ncbi:DUF924 family protein [Amphiplicatus metriothermophilus]|uniref:Uncharacterized conserved protein, DUF924 family n=1 Tax=Amphiplicatus metriothermophilus TaxID=1519374 RepID=A0A239PY29_9PROT|nr:DUF924 family protein [Amphiplicatus metriothermophilus]MBB5519771.1 uncharacterized protein (DUF924 family) [Amphiplicatus metriothermophilus]SNT75221.1 Uncharacterized conserved protein, DUF924 family [Amphiplicatus metriothermophilus]
MTEEIDPGEVVGFWREAGPKAWFKKDAAFDEEIRRRFEALHHAAARGERAAWEESSGGALALVLLLDQFPRNMYRGSAHAFATDGLARRVAGAAIRRGFDRQADESLRVFFYMPFEHSEDPADQARAVELIEALGDEEYAKFARLHADVIARFGRFPHRNACLGRASTPEELAFLEAGGFSG